MMYETVELIESEKRKEIEESLEQNIFVEAGAGAGKTTLIVNRIVNQLKYGISPENIVVITFTNAAAEELRSRITKKVREACTEKGISEKEKKHLREALKQLDFMKMSTIHSFCFTLLQERSFDAKLPMNAVLIEEEEAKVWQQKIFKEWASNLKTADWELLSHFGTRREVITNIKTFFLDICELSDDMEIYCNKEQFGGDSYETAKQLFESYQKTARQLVEDFAKMFCIQASILCGKTCSKVSDIPVDELISEAKKMQAMFGEKELPYFEILDWIVKPMKTQKKYFSKRTNIAKEQDVKCRAWFEQQNREAVESLLAQYNDYKYTQLLVYALKAREYYRLTRLLSKITNDALLQKTNELICNSEEARKYFAKKISCLYVDEFQDTDHLQEEFIWKLCADENDFTKLRNGSLFLVGDPKQSIYRFRGAEPEVYFRTKEKMKCLENAKVYCLNHNYRSNEKIISWVNSNFQERDISLEAYQPMVCQKSLPETLENVLAGVYCDFNQNQKAIEQDKKKETREEKRRKKEKNAQDLAILIEKLVQNENKCKITDYENGKPYVRPIKYADFLVLCYGKKDMDIYLRKMQEREIPVQIYGEIVLNHHIAVTNFVHIFDYLTHSFDKAKRVGALEVLIENGVLQEEAVLEELRKNVQHMSGFGIAQYLAEQFEYLLPVNLSISREQICSVQTKLQQMLEKVFTMENSDGTSLAEKFWKYQESILERELALEENGQAVRFMNLHKAKGLEGNIVILTKRDEHMKFHQGAYRKGKKYYPALSNCYEKIIWNSYNNNVSVLEKAQREEFQEQTRLQYVAATRAKQVFIMMEKMSEDCMFSDYCFDENIGVKNIVTVLNGLPERLHEEAIIKDYQINQRKVLQKTDADAAKQERIMFKKLAPSMLEVSSKTRENAFKKKVEQQKAQGEMEQIVARKRPKGNVFGTTMHRSLELIIERWRINFAQQPNELEKIIQMSISQAILENKSEIPEEEKEIYKSFLKEILDCFCQWVYECKLFIHDDVMEIHTEYPFSFYEENNMTEGENCPVWVNGTADLMIRDKAGKITILDYKSDNDDYLTEEEFEISLQERYGGQLNMYRYAMARLYGVKQDDVALGIISFTEKTGKMQVRYSKM